MTDEVKKGSLIISTPYLGDPHFDRSVILICEHGDDGSLGFVLNKQTELYLSEILPLKGCEIHQVYLGGPVQQDTLHYIHTIGKNLTEATQVTNKVWWSGNFELLKEMMENGMVTEDQVRYFIGYSGWSPGQLEKEITDNNWIIIDQAPDDVLDIPSEFLWRELLLRLGGKYKIMANSPIDPRLN